jgi:ribosome biogenesis GTPase
LLESLTALGWTASFADAFRPFEDDHVPGRIVAEHRGMYVAMTATGELSCEITGRMRHRTDEREDLPAAGDWVALRRTAEGDRASIDAVLPRTTAFVRKEAGFRTQGQVLAANIDLVWIVAALTVELSARRVERYLTVAWESGAQPVVVLTKADIGDADQSMVGEVEQVAVGSDIVVCSAVTGEGLDVLGASIAPNRTAALLGSSGVGKSTLVNALVGEELLATQPTRGDAVGRHTTTHRELIRVPGGGMLIDTPGLRELVAWDAESGIDSVFGDIEELTARCRFNDCAHDREPGCAIREALANGELDRGRWRSYQKMLREMDHLSGRKRERIRGRNKEISKFARDRRKAQRARQVP